MDIDKVLDKVDKETVSVVDAVEKVDGEKDKVDGQKEVKPGEEKSQESNNGGWVTQLPKELREGIDPKYTSLAEYIQDLRANQKKDGEDSANEGDWESVAKEIDGEEYGEGEKAILKEITSKLKEEGVKPKSGMKSIKIFVEEQEKAKKLFREKREKEANDYIVKSWKDNEDKNMKSFENGLRVLKGIDPGLLKEVKDNRLDQSPAFVEAIRVLGERTNEKAISSGGSLSEKDTYDPKNPLKL